METIVFCGYCGCEISSNDKKCPHCSAVNDYYIKMNDEGKKTYVKEYHHSKNNPNNIPNTKKIKSSKQRSDKICQNVLNITKDSISINLVIVSGKYKAYFSDNNSYEMSKYKEFKTFILINSIFYSLFLISLIGGIIPLMLEFVFKLTVLEYLTFRYFLVLAIIFFLSYFIININENSFSSAKYEYIIYELKKKGAKITYQNESTGTISYILGGKKTQISVYRGYNSHANSRYWK